MVQNKPILIALALMALVSCTQTELEREKKYSAEMQMQETSSVSKDECMRTFSLILSKAVSKEQSVRSFLKDQALTKMDNGYNVFYGLVKDKKIGDRTFEDVLSDYEGETGTLAKIEQNVPLLNIHIPEFMSNKVENFDVTDTEVPILFQNKLYYAGQLMDSLAADEIPGFNLFVVSESSSIRPKRMFTRSTGNCYINDKYEYVDEVFNPINTRNGALTRASVEYDELDEKYTEKGFIPKEDIDPLLIQAYNNAKGKKRATRYLMYYGLDNTEQTPGEARADIRDCIFRFKIAQDAFAKFEYVAIGDVNIQEGDKEKSKKEDKRIFNDKTTNKKRPLSREAILQRLLTGRAFCFLFSIEGSIDGSKVVAENMKIYATPEKIFNLRINEHRRHKTWFRHTKYTYTIDRNGIKSKWFYPLDHGHDTRLNRWDISKDPLEKKITAYLLDPDAGLTVDVTENYSVTYILGGELGANISIPIKKVELGINGKLNNSNTETKSVTRQYKITRVNELIDEFQFHFFDDYPIENVLDNGYVVPIRKGKGVLETCIIPISNEYFTEKRFNK